MIYSLGLALYMILAAPFYLARMSRGRYRASIRQRLGLDLPKAMTESSGAMGLQSGTSSQSATGSRSVSKQTLWIHACSVGEAEAAKPLVEIVRRVRPDLMLIISTVTETGQARAHQLFPDASVRYLPFDFLFAVRRCLDAAGPLVAFLIIETEIWPNLIQELRRRRVPVGIANGRISDRAWPRYRAAAFLFRPILASLVLVAARTEEDAARFRHIGAAHVEAAGNIKFDRPAAALPVHAPSGRFLVFGSTHQGEEEIALRVFSALRPEFPNLRLIIAPRHIERAATVARMTEGAQRSIGWKDEPILILDTHGELGGMYALADVAVIGGSFASIGGHNPLEAAIHGVPTLWGPHIENFRDACSLLSRPAESGIGGGKSVADEAELLARLRELLKDDNLRHAWGVQARAAVLANRGAAERQWRMFAEAAGLLENVTIQRDDAESSEKKLEQVCE